MVKNQGTKQRGQRTLGDCWQWKSNGQCSCESGFAYHGITDFVTNTLMKVQHVAVSENSVHNSCSTVVIWT